MKTVVKDTLDIRDRETGGGGVGLMRGFERRNLASQSLDMTPIAQRTGVEARERTGESVT
jgi:hypothetical protein